MISDRNKRIICISDVIGSDGKSIALTACKLYLTYEHVYDDEYYYVINNFGVLYPYNVNLFQLESEYRNEIINEIMT